MEIKYNWPSISMGYITSKILQKTKWKTPKSSKSYIWICYISATIHIAFQFCPVQSLSRVGLFATPTLCDPMNRSTPGLSVHHQLPESTQTHVHWVGDAIQPSHPLSCPSPPVLNLSKHQALPQWVSSSHQVAKVLEFQLQHQSFQWIFRTHFL